MNEILQNIFSNSFMYKEFCWYALVSIVLLAICCMSQVLFTERKKYIAHYFLIEYSFLVLCFTVICRKKGELEQFFPIPFHDYGNRETGIFLSEMLMNVLMFVPIGALMKNAFSGMRWHHAMAAGFVISLCIELLQWTFKCGSCETNDLINNTLGAIVGYWLISIRFLKCRKI